MGQREVLHFLKEYPHWVSSLEVSVAIGCTRGKAQLSLKKLYADGNLFKKEQERKGLRTIPLYKLK